MNRYVLHAANVLGATLMAIIALQLSCTNSNPAGDTSANGSDTDALVLDEDGRPIGWTDATHGKTAAANYALVFPQGEVRRIDITISPSNWQAMLDDMTANYGQFGQGGGGSPGGGGNGNVTPPPEMTDACQALQEGDACTIAFNGMTAQGTCTASGDGQLICRPQMATGIPPGGQPGANGDATPAPEMLDACGTLQEGDTCTVSFNGTTVQGTCTATGDGQLACNAQMAPGAGGGMPGGDGMLSTDDENPVFVPCTLAFEDNTWWYVGVRFKGQSSLMSTWSAGIYKLPFRLDFDESEDDHPEIADQRFYGFKDLSLASNWSDRSFLREKVTYDVFREAGVPAPRTAFYRVYVDYGEGAVYFGLYTMTEIPDTPMLETQFGDDSGNLYKPTSNWVEFREEDFDKETNEDEADFSDVQAAIAALHADRSDPTAWRAGLEAVFDVDGFLHWLAVNTVIQNWDTYGNMAQNYYLYGEPDDDGRLTWIPWDNNMALGSDGGGMGGTNGFVGTNGVEGGNPMGGMGRALSLSLDEVNDNWPLIRYLADDPVYWSVYVSYVRETIEGAFAVEPTQARYKAEHDLIAPYVVGTEGEQPGHTFLSDPQEFEDGLQDLLKHVQQRRDAALEFLGTTE